MAPVPLETLRATPPVDNRIDIRRIGTVLI